MKSFLGSAALLLGGASLLRAAFGVPVGGVLLGVGRPGVLGLPGRGGGGGGLGLDARLTGDRNIMADAESGHRVRLGSVSMRTILVIRQDDKDGPDLPLQPRVDPPDDACNLGCGKVDREGCNRFHIVVALDSSIGSTLSWCDLDQGPWIIADDLNLRARIRVPVALGDELENADPDLGLRGNAIFDRERLQGLGSLVTTTTKKERSELGTNSLGIGNELHLDVVSDNCVRLTCSRILNEQNPHLLAHQQPDHVLSIANSLVLPGLAGDIVRNPGCALEHEAVLETLILEEVRHLRVDGNLVVDNAIETAMILFEGNDPILKHSGGLASLDD